MELRKLKISYIKSGSGSWNTRLNIPISWIKELEISQDDREVFVYKINDKIIISKKLLKWNTLEVGEIIKTEIVKIINQKEYINSKEISEIYMNIMNCYKFNSERDKKNQYFNLHSKVQEFLEKKYNLVLNNDEEYFFDKKYEFKKVDELKTFFDI
ncbi:hypothetical protein [Fusobacterium sp. SYSU M8D902]|uniref:hypothetical protein n=1 Tax=Fusobacterium sp. SYSU M8D902 TaxID=3159562 RepID=UPI0032E4B085